MNDGASSMGCSVATSAGGMNFANDIIHLDLEDPLDATNGANLPTVEPVVQSTEPMQVANAAAPPASVPQPPTRDPYVGEADHCAKPPRKLPPRAATVEVDHTVEPKPAEGQAMLKEQRTSTSTISLTPFGSRQRAPSCPYSAAAKAASPAAVAAAAKHEETIKAAVTSEWDLLQQKQQEELHRQHLYQQQQQHLAATTDVGGDTVA